MGLHIRRMKCLHLPQQMSLQQRSAASHMLQIVQVRMHDTHTLPSLALNTAMDKTQSKPSGVPPAAPIPQAGANNGAVMEGGSTAFRVLNFEIYAVRCLAEVLM